MGKSPKRAGTAGPEGEVHISPYLTTAWRKPDSLKQRAELPAVPCRIIRCNPADRASPLPRPTIQMCALAAGHLLEVEGSRGADQVAELPEAEKAGIEEGVVLERPGAPWPKVPLPSYWTTTILIQLGCWVASESSHNWRLVYVQC